MQKKSILRENIKEMKKNSLLVELTHLNAGLDLILLLTVKMEKALTNLKGVRDDDDDDYDDEDNANVLRLYFCFTLSRKKDS
jgi:hypothetical protein